MTTGPRRRSAMLATLAVIGCATHQAAPRAEPLRDRQRARVTAFGVDSALRRIFDRPPLWPDFQPALTPVAIYDGRTTVLFRHPAPPAEFISLSRERGVYAMPGRHPLVSANTSVILGGKPTATVLLDTTSTTSAEDWAALTTHEIFHVYQRARHPSWSGNEANLFTYPLEDTTALAWRRVETLALSRALSAASIDSVRCWARTALTARATRFARLGAAAAEYERGTELNEGLATYVERRAAQRPVTLASADLPAEQVRQRAYGVGAALAAVLDRIGAGWRETLEHAPDSARLSLDGLLAKATDAAGPESPARCSVSAAERAAFSTEAAAEAGALAERRIRERATFLADTGWRVIVESGAQPLFLQRFDPLNVSLLTPTEIVHRRMLRLGNDAGWIELVGRASLTEGRAGQHPLFAGVRRLTVAASRDPVTVRDSAGVTLVDGSGLRARFALARVDTSRQIVRIRLR